MTEEDIRYLQQCLTVGLIVWYMGRDGWDRISRISKHPEEDLPVGWLHEKTGRYVALENCDDHDIMVTSPEITRLPSKTRASGGT